MSRATHQRPHRDVEDRELVTALVAGNREALGTLYDRHAARMLGLAARILRDRLDAEDLVHDVFLEAWHRAAAYDASRASVRSWLVMRTRSRALDRARALAVARRHTLGMRDTEPAWTADALEYLRPESALAGLSAEQREAVHLAYYCGLSCREIAARCAIPVGTVKSRLSAAIAKLRQRIEREGAQSDA